MLNSAIADNGNTSTDNMVDILVAALEGDIVKIRKIASQLSHTYTGPEAETTKQYLRQLLAKSPIELRPLRDPEKLPVDMKSRFPLLQKQEWPTEPLILDDALAHELELTIEEISNARLLEAEGLASRNAILLHGVPGTGKSLIAGHLAMRLGRPLLTIRLDTLISSLLGDTAKNIRAIFEYAMSSKAVLFLDEVDAVAKKRDDSKELGELKRVVNALLQGLDLLDSETTVVAATNHPHMLDSAIWRRFPFQYEVRVPSIDMRENLWAHYLYKDEATDNVSVLATVSEGLTGSDIKEIAHAARKRSIITKTAIDPMSIVRAILESTSGEIKRPNFRQPAFDVTAKHYSRLYNDFGLTQLQIAHLANVSKQSVSKVLKSQKNTK